MRTLLASTHRAVDFHAAPEVKDAALIAVAQRIEHYEIAGYGTARTFAEILSQDEVAEILQETLDEEGETDKRLTAIAETINAEAEAESQTESEAAPE